MAKKDTKTIEVDLSKLNLSDDETFINSLKEVIVSKLNEFNIPITNLEDQNKFVDFNMTMISRLGSGFRNSVKREYEKREEIIRERFDKDYAKLLESKEYFEKSYLDMVCKHNALVSELNTERTQYTLTLAKKDELIATLQNDFFKKQIKI